MDLIGYLLWLIDWLLRYGVWLPHDALGLMAQHLVQASGLGEELARCGAATWAGSWGEIAFVRDHVTDWAAYAADGSWPGASDRWDWCAGES